MEKQTDLDFFITKHYNLIKNNCQFKAFKFFINFDDLLSEVHNGLTRASKNGSFIGGEDDFFKYLNLAIHNSAINVYRRGKMKNVDKFTDFESIRDNYSGLTTTQPDYDSKDILNKVRTYFNVSLANKKNTHWLEIFDLYFICELKYEEIASILDIPLSTVKNTIFRIREMANKKFGSLYNNLYKSA